MESEALVSLNATIEDVLKTAPAYYVMVLPAYTSDLADWIAAPSVDRKDLSPATDGYEHLTVEDEKAVIENTIAVLQHILNERF